MIIDIRFFHFLACVKVTISFFHSNQSSGNSKIWHSAFCWLSGQNADIFVKDKIKLEFPNLWNTPLTNCINYLEDSIVQNLIIPVFGLPIIDNNFKALLRDFWPTPRLKTLPELISSKMELRKRSKYLIILITAAPIRIYRVGAFNSCSY